MNQKKISGTIIGLAIGDAFGAPYEGGIPERLLWAVIGKKRGKRRWTDDTRMTIDVIESLIEKGTIDQNDLARRFAESYHWSRGYGPGAAKILKRIRNGEGWKTAGFSVYKDGSFGNGGAMRAPVIGLFYADDYLRTADAARKSAMITHAHPEGIEGAVLIATATALAYNGSIQHGFLEKLSGTINIPVFLTKLEKARGWIADNHEPSPGDVAKELGNGITAKDSCVTAVYLALRFAEKPGSDLLSFIRKTGGDTDTIGAMALAIWGAACGIQAFPETMTAALEQFSRLNMLSISLGEKIGRKG